MTYLKEFLITGGSGMVGRAFEKDVPNAAFISSKDCDLREKEQVNELFNTYKPKYV